MTISPEDLKQFAALNREEQALELARQSVETELLSLRNSRISHLSGGNGFVIRERDGSESSAIRLRTREGLKLAIDTYTRVMALAPEHVEAELLRLDARYDEVEAERLAVENDEPSAMFIVET